MTENTTPKQDIVIPRGLALFVRVSPVLLPDEEEDDYFDLFDAMAEEIAPTTNLEWFALNDTVDILWDMSRLRLWKHAMLVIGRHRVVETALMETQYTTTSSQHPNRIALTKQEARVFHSDSEDRDALEARLNEAGYTSEGLNAAALMEVLVPLAAIDRFLCSARGQLNAIMKELGVRRNFAERARKAFDERIAVEVKVPAVNQIESMQ
jgi:hypothetical protein